MNNTHPVSKPRRQILAQALFHPRALAVTLESDPRWGYPAALIILTTVVLDLLALPLFLRALPQMAPSGLSPEMVAELVERSRILKPTQILLSPFGLLAKWAITAFLLRLMATLMNRPVHFRKLLALVVYANVVHLLETVTKNLLLWSGYVATGAIDLNPPVGVDALVHPSGVVGSTLLRYANPFEVWFLAVLIRGVASLAGTTSVRGTAIVLPTWGFWLAADLALALVREILTRQLGI
ncbi:MAG TPA: YIP1 family protein [Blastocatellia bacterium]|nr:YIP1 family protein [Blastocatellia bacterium]